MDLQHARVGESLSLMDAKVLAPLKMGGLRVEQRLHMGGTSEFEDIELQGAAIGDQLTLDGAKVTGTLMMSGLHAGRGLFMRNGAEFKEVDLHDATVSGQLSLQGAKVSGDLIMNGLKVGGSLHMREKAEFTGKLVDLSGAKVGKHLDLNGVKVTGALKMKDLQVNNSILIGKKAEFSEVDLASANVGYQISILDSIVNGSLNMNALRIGQNLMVGKGTEFRGDKVELDMAKVGGLIYLSGCIFSGSLQLCLIRVEGNVVMGKGAQFKNIFFRGANIRGYLDFRNAVIQGSLDLRQCSVENFRDSDNWPQTYYINGFRYRQIEHKIADRGFKWFRTWLGNQMKFSPESYEVLAQALVQGGYQTKANMVRFEGKQCQRRHADWRQLPILVFQLLFVGYGFKMYYAVIWVVLLTAIGMGILTRISLPVELQLNTWLELGFYTFDTLLPIVELNPDHAKVISHLPSTVKTYFYFLKIMGWVIASFLVAGLSGLTKKIV